LGNETFLALFTFAFVSSVTPGPNNLMLMASGANFGFKRTLPHMLGVGFGFSFMISVIGVGAIRLFEIWPPIYNVLKVVSVVYMLWLAWKIAHAAPPEEKAATQKPFTFLQAGLFQWVNPKGWTMALTAVTVYAPHHDLHTVLFISMLFGLINVIVISSWVLLGTGMSRWLSNKKRLRIFNWTMAALLVGSLALML
jgi:threonine/homoserine/homoserine lactone efflux protein